VQFGARRHGAAVILAKRRSGFPEIGMKIRSMGKNRLKSNVFKASLKILPCTEIAESVQNTAPRLPRPHKAGAHPVL
jgi:hypothetical protein